MKILVTGSSGFVGCHLVKKLLEDGHKVVGIDNHNDYYSVSLKEHRKNSLESPNFKFYMQDINDISIPEVNFDIAINLAAQAGVRVKKEKEHLYDHSNKNGFEAFCKTCQLKGIPNIIYASSSSVYSDSDTKKFNEDKTKLKPISKYGASKLANEIYATKLANNTDLSIIGLRFFSVYGPLGRPDMAYFLFTKAITNQEIIFLNNNGTMSRDMTFIDDAVQGILGSVKVISKEGKKYKNEIFNIGNDSPISTKKLLETIEKKLHKNTIVKNYQTNNEALITHADITKARNILGYKPRVGFENGIDIFLEWYSSYENV